MCGTTDVVHGPGGKAGPAELGPGKARETGMDSCARALRLPGSAQRWDVPPPPGGGGLDPVTWRRAELPLGGTIS